MIPLIGLLLCVYLMFKGLEIFQIAHSNPEAPLSAVIVGLLALGASVVLAVIFAFLFISSAAAVPSLPTLPRI